MRKSLRILPLLFASLTAGTICLAQDRFAYAVTDNQVPGSGWSFLRKLDLKSGQFSPVILNGTDQTVLAFDASSRRQFNQPLTDARYGQLANAAFGTGVAAMAYDKRSNRLYYTPMFIDQLRYIDLKTMSVYYLTDKPFTGKPDKSSDQGNIVTRMVIASDGNGYAMTNDGTQLIQFSTGKKTTIIDLGSIVDDQANSNISIHNSCSSYGGDMIADDDGNLYVFSARNHVFRIDLDTKVATHLGSIQGLPANFTVNGAAVNENNAVLVASATLAGSYFLVDMKNLSAEPYNIGGGPLQSSDLANSNLLQTGKQASFTDVTRSRPAITDEMNTRVTIFPNPVTNNQFVIQFGQIDAGSYTIQVTDVMGKQVFSQAITLSGDNQSQQIKLGTSTSKGVYLLKLLNTNNKPVFSTKVVVQ
jgi:hypothetical protein